MKPQIPILSKEEKEAAIQETDRQIAEGCPSSTSFPRSFHQGELTRDNPGALWIIVPPSTSMLGHQQQGNHRPTHRLAACPVVPEGHVP